MRKLLAQLADDQGTAAAAALVGIHPQTLAGVLAGLPGHRSTIALVERRLAEMDQKDVRTVAPSGVQWPADWNPEEGWPEVGDGRTPDGTRSWAEIDAVLREHGTSLEEVAGKLKGRG